MRWAATKAAAIGNSRGSSGSSGGSRGWRVAATRHTSSSTTSTADGPFRSSYGLWIDNQEVSSSCSCPPRLLLGRSTHLDRPTYPTQHQPNPIHPSTRCRARPRPLEPWSAARRRARS